MSSPKDKQVFTESLKGLKTAKDRFGTPIAVGEIIAYATVQYQSPIMKVAKILAISRKEGASGDIDDQRLTLRVQGAHKSVWNQEGDWALQQKSSLKKIDNVIVITDPTEEILYLFKDVV